MVVSVTQLNVFRRLAHPMQSIGLRPQARSDKGVRRFLRRKGNWVPFIGTAVAYSICDERMKLDEIPPGRPMADPAQTCQTQKWVGCVRDGSECEADPSHFFALGSLNSNVPETGDRIPHRDQRARSRAGRTAGIGRRTSSLRAFDRRGHIRRNTRRECRSNGASRHPAQPTDRP